MASRGNEVEKNVDTVVPKTRITLNSGFLSENIVILSLEISNNLRKACPISETFLDNGKWTLT
jgi:hypothetical protein